MFGLHGFDNLVGPMRFSIIIGLIATVCMLFPQFKKSERNLAIACSMIFVSLFIDKGVGLVLGGFVPNPFNRITEYYPSVIELGIVAAVWAAGALILTILYKIAVTVKNQHA